MLGNPQVQPMGQVYAGEQPRRRAGALSGRRTEHPIIDHTFYHTSMDTPDLVPAAGLQSAVQAFAKIVDEVNRMDLRDAQGDMYP